MIFFRNSFICKNWLSLTQGDGKVERVIPVAGEEDLKNKNRLFHAWTRNKLFDDVSDSFTQYSSLICLDILLSNFTLKRASLLRARKGIRT